MSTSLATLVELHDLAKAYLLAKSAFNRAYVRYWEAEVQPCPDETGWKLLSAFRREVETFRFKYGRTDQGIQQAAWEILRLELVDKADYGFEDVVGFAKWYRRLKGKIDQAIGHLYDYHGDSFGDLVDSYPLAGLDLIERALATHPQSNRPRRDGYLDAKELSDVILEALGPQWHKLICNGENYIESALETACYKCFLHRILTGRDGRIAWTDEERSKAEFAGHYGD
jgi:hypothetical protein